MAAIGLNDLDSIVEQAFTQLNLQSQAEEAAVQEVATF